MTSKDFLKDFKMIEVRVETLEVEVVVAIEVEIEIVLVAEAEVDEMETEVDDQEVEALLEEEMEEGGDKTSSFTCNAFFKVLLAFL